MVVDLKVLDSIVYDDDPEHIKISLPVKTLSPNLSPKTFVSFAKLTVLCLPVKKKPLT